MNIYGWDLLYASDLELINEKFKSNAKSLASSFNFETKDLSFGTSVSIIGNFGIWELASTGSNKIIQLSLPVNQIGIAGTGVNIECNSSTVVLEIALDFIPDQVDKSKHNLQFDYTGQDDGNKSSIKVKSVEDNDNKLGVAQLGLLGEAVKACLENSPEKFNYIFATISLNESSSNWLSPQNVSYSIARLNDGKNYFCVFGSHHSSTDLSSNTTGSVMLNYFKTYIPSIYKEFTTTDNKDLKYQVDPSLFIPDDSLFLMINANLFFKQFLVPIFKSKFKAGGFVLGASSLMLFSIPLPSTKKGAITYHPLISMLSISIKNNALAINLSGSCDLKASISMSFDYNSTHAIQIAKDGSSINILPDPNAHFSHKEDLGVWKYIAIIPVAGIAAAIAALITNSIASSLSSVISSQAQSSCKVSINNLKWAHTDFGKINDAGFADNFYLRGNEN